MILLPKIDEDLFIQTAFDIILNPDEIILDDDPLHPKFKQIGADVSGTLCYLSKDGLEKFKKSTFKHLEKYHKNKALSIRLKALLDEIRRLKTARGKKVKLSELGLDEDEIKEIFVDE